MGRASRVAPPHQPSLALDDLVALRDCDDLVPGGHVDRVDLAGTDLSDRRLVDLVVEESRWRDVVLDGADLRGARLNELRLGPASAATLRAPRSRWRECEVADSRFGTLDLSGAEVERVAVRRCRLGFVNLRGAVVTDLLLDSCTVDEVDLTDATVTRLAFTGSRVDVIDVAVASARDLDLRGSGVSTLNGIRSLDGVVLDEDQARWFAPLIAAKLGARVL